MGPDAGVLAEVVAHPAQDRRQRVVLPGEGDRRGEVALAHRRHVLGNLLVHRALVDAGRLDAVEEVQLPGRLGAIGAEGLLV